MNRAKEVRDVQGQGAAEAQQAEYGRQQLQNQALTARAQMRDASEFNRAGMLDQSARDRTLAELQRRRDLLPQLIQTGGSSSGSGYNSQVIQQQPSLWNSIGGAAQVGAAAIPFL
jgi:hypothetical protein